MYPVVRQPAYDFTGQSYASSYPNLHKYPATMLPQIGIKLFEELNITTGKLLDPYCGSGSSFIVGLDRGLTEMYGYDINPLAVLITRAKFTKLDLNCLREQQQILRDTLYAVLDSNITFEKPAYHNVDYWFSDTVLHELLALRHCIEQIGDEDIRRLFLVPFSETVRECSYTRNNEFKLYRIKPEDVEQFQVDVVSLYFQKLRQVMSTYEFCYYPLLDSQRIEADYETFRAADGYYDVVLTSPPYGDSRTTVAYGQFSTFGNEWLGIDYARQIDKMLMGGKKAPTLYTDGIIADAIADISRQSQKRALEISAFYVDLATSIAQVANKITTGGKVIYVVGNRRVKNVQLPTDQFIAEQFERHHCKHIITYERRISNKVMPSKNSPTNKKGRKTSTMTQEFIVICEKI